MGKLYRLRPHHKRAIREALATGNLVSILSCPRGWGKTGIAAPLLVWAFFDQPGAQVMTTSTSMRTSRLAYDRAVRIIELNPRLSDQVLIYSNSAEPYMVMPHRGSQMFPLPAQEKHIVGMDPTFVLIDEVGYVDRGTLTTMTSSLGKVDDSLLVGIGTPGLGAVSDGEPNIMWSLREQANGSSPPPGLRFIEFSADPDCDIHDRKQWKKANPGVGDLVSWDAVALDAATLPPSVFRQMRLGLWVQHERAWMTPEVWDAIPVDVGQPRDGASICLGFDGSVSGDGTALVGYELGTGRLFVVGWWQRPAGDQTWKVPRPIVEMTIEAAFTRWNVVYLYADPPFWREELARWSLSYGDRIVEFPTFARSRMAAATDRLYASIQKGELRTDGNPDLRAHALSAVAEMTPMGEVVRKDARKPSLIDLLVAGILAHEAGAAAESRPTPAIF
jgi:phage terminase large subunit-like protein